MIWKQSQEEYLVFKPCSYAGPIVMVWSTYLQEVFARLTLWFAEKQCEGFPEERCGRNCSLLLVHEWHLLQSS